MRQAPETSTHKYSSPPGKWEVEKSGRKSIAKRLLEVKGKCSPHGHCWSLLHTQHRKGNSRYTQGSERRGSGRQLLEKWLSAVTFDEKERRDDLVSTLKTLLITNYIHQTEAGLANLSNFKNTFNFYFI